MVKNPPANVGDAKDGFDPLVRKNPGETNGNLLRYSCLGNPMNREALSDSPWGHKEPDATEHAHTCTHLDCTGFRHFLCY